MSKKKNNIIKFPSSISKIERKVEAILFAASEPLDIETIEKRLQNVKNVKKILDKIQLEYKSRGINLVCIRNKWSFRTAEDLSKLINISKIISSRNNMFIFIDSYSSSKHWYFS